MKCQYCNGKLAIHDLWCVNCGKRTDVISKDLSAISSLKLSWAKYKSVKGKNLPVGILSVLIGILPIYFLLWAFNFTTPDLPVWQVLMIRNIAWLLIIPMTLVQFTQICKRDDYILSVKDYLAAFNTYFKYILFILVSVVYYLVIHFICQGDPILNLVWLVLVVYWITVILPCPILMERFKINVFKAIRLSYKDAGDIRWNLFLMIILLFSLNFIATVLFIIGLAITLPFSWFAIRDYVDKLIDYEVFQYVEKV